MISPARQKLRPLTPGESSSGYRPIKDLNSIVTDYFRFQNY